MLDTNTILNVIFITLFVLSEILGAIPANRLPYGSVIQIILVATLKLLSILVPSLAPLANMLVVATPPAPVTNLPGVTVTPVDPPNQPTLPARINFNVPPEIRTRVVITPAMFPKPNSSTPLIV
jgi:hypothetical protein